MSVDLNKFFRIGLDTTENPIDQSLIIQQRTAPDNINRLQNKVIFKIPKQGILTRDSMLKVPLFKLSDGENTRTNLLNGILGSITRVVLKADNKVITDREFPSYTNTNFLYANYTNVEMLNYWKFLLGNGLALEAVKKEPNTEGSLEALRISEKIFILTPYVDAPNSPVLNIQDMNLGLTADGTNTRPFGIPLWLLSPFFMNNSLPVFLMRSTRDITLEITFSKDQTDYIIGSDNMRDNNKFSVVLDSIELCTTHIIQSPDAEMMAIDNAKNKPLNYQYNDEYLIKYKVNGTSGNINETIRANLNTRRLNRFLMVFKPLRTVQYDFTATSNQLFASQLSTAFGDQTLQVKMNGTEIFQHPVDSDPLLFHLTSIYNDNKPLQFTRAMTSFNSHMASRLDPVEVESPLTLNFSSTQLLGTCNYIGVSVTNGNAEPLLSSTVQTTPLEINYTSTRNTKINNYPMNNIEHSILLYPQIFKQVSISPSSVVVSY